MKRYGMDGWMDGGRQLRTDSIEISKKGEVDDTIDSMHTKQY
jgi:hypothetical protein